jgi:hypothetical protein
VVAEGAAAAINVATLEAEVARLKDDLSQKEQIVTGLSAQVPSLQVCFCFLPTQLKFGTVFMNHGFQLISEKSREFALVHFCWFKDKAWHVTPHMSAEPRHNADFSQ